MMRWTAVRDRITRTTVTGLAVLAVVLSSLVGLDALADEVATHDVAVHVTGSGSAEGPSE